jgi:DNA-binding SARP family transcriptional activator
VRPTPPDTQASLPADEALLLGRLTAALTTALARPDAPPAGAGGDTGVSRIAGAAVTWARRVTGADAAELYLTDPLSGDAVLTAYSGLHRASFTAVPRFPPGHGFPGLIVARGEPVASSHLAADARFARPRALQRGFVAYVGVPLPDPGAFGPARPLGAYAIAWRRQGVPLARMRRVLDLGASTVAVVLQAALYRVRRASSAAVPSPAAGGGDALDSALSETARRAALLVAADGAIAYALHVGTTRLARSATAGEWPDGDCPALFRPEDGTRCPALGGAGGLALTGGRASWPPACRLADRRGALWYCLPLTAGGRPVGLLQASHRQATPALPTSPLRALLEAADAAGPLVAAARDALSAPQSSNDARPDHPESAAAPCDRALATAPILDVRCFGPFELRVGGVLVTREQFARRMALTLLKILVTYRDRPVPSETLVEWLWPESDPLRGANRLHAVAHALRRVIETPGSPPVVVNDRGFYRLSPGTPLRLDVDEFLAAVRRGRQADARTDPVAALAEYESALRACRGDFMEDEPFGEWCWQEREHLRELRMGALERAAALYAAAGDVERSLACLRQGLRVDPLREDLHRAALDLLVRVGRHDEALGRYAALRAELARELGAAPLPETELVMQGIGGSAAAPGAARPSP